MQRSKTKRTLDDHLTNNPPTTPETKSKWSRLKRKVSLALASAILAATITTPQARAASEQLPPLAITNPATFQQATPENKLLAYEGLVTIFTTTGYDKRYLAPKIPLERVVDGYELKLTTNNNITIDAPIIYLDGNQLNGVIPGLLDNHKPNQQVTFQLYKDGTPITQPAKATISHYAPSIFISYNGWAAAINHDHGVPAFLPIDYNQETKQWKPLQPGEILELYVTGTRGGDTPTADEDVPSTLTFIKAYQEGRLTLEYYNGETWQPLTTIAAAQTPQFVGVDQINAITPNDPTINNTILRFRIKITNDEGTTTYSNEAGLPITKNNPYNGRALLVNNQPVSAGTTLHTSIGDAPIGPNGNYLLPHKPTGTVSMDGSTSHYSMKEWKADWPLIPLAVKEGAQHVRAALFDTTRMSEEELEQTIVFLDGEYLDTLEEKYGWGTLAELIDPNFHPINAQPRDKILTWVQSDKQNKHIESIDYLRMQSLRTLQRLLHGNSNPAQPLPVWISKENEDTRLHPYAGEELPRREIIKRLVTWFNTSVYRRKKFVMSNQEAGTRGVNVYWIPSTSRDKNRVSYISDLVRMYIRADNPNAAIDFHEAMHAMALAPYHVALHPLLDLPESKNPAAADHILLTSVDYVTRKHFENRGAWLPDAFLYALRVQDTIQLLIGNDRINPWQHYTRPDEHYDQTTTTTKSQTPTTINLTIE